MLKLLILLICLNVYSASNLNSFIQKGQRAELFELTDNEVGTLRITLPEKEFDTFKSIMKSYDDENENEDEDDYDDYDENDFENYELIENEKITFNSLEEIISSIKQDITEKLQILKKGNYNEIYPGYNFQENLSELKINKNGYPQFNLEEILKNYDFNVNHYENFFLDDYDKIQIHIYKSNSKFSLNKILMKLSTLNVNENTNLNEDFENLIHFVKEHTNNYNDLINEIFEKEKENILTTINRIEKGNFKEVFSAYNIQKILPELNINENGFPQLNTTEILSGYIFNTEDYTDYYIIKDSNFFERDLLHSQLLQSNPEFNLESILQRISKLKISNVTKINPEFGDFLFEFQQYYNTFDYRYQYLLYIVQKMKETMQQLKIGNYKEIYPGYHFNSILPELNIGEDGYAHFNEDNILQGFDFDVNHYNFNNEIESQIYNSNPNFNFNRIFLKILELEISDDAEIDQNFENFIEILKRDYNVPSTFKDFVRHVKQEVRRRVTQISKGNFKEIFPSYNFNEKLSELKIGEDGYPHLNINEIFKGFDFDVNHYLEYDASNGYNYELYNQLFTSNPNFNLKKIYEEIAELNISNDNNIKMDPEFEKLMNEIVIGKINNSDDDDIYKNFKTKNASMTFEINGTQSNFNQITFSVGGRSSRSYSKLGYNIKINGKNKLYGLKQIRLRSDFTEPTYLRTKLITDIHNRLGLPSISSNFVNLYINNENMGLYILMDVYKKSWIESVYNEKDTKLLYKCEMPSKLSIADSVNNCYNENEYIRDKTEWKQFLTTLDNAKSASDIEGIFEIDHFLTEIAIDYLTGSWDHMIHNGHNYYMYKQPENGKWIYLSFDFDFDFGIYSEYTFNVIYGEDHLNKIINNLENISFSEWSIPHHLLDILIFKDSRRFEKILKEIIEKVFNPTILYQRIDDLKELIKPYVIIDKTVNEEGKYPGRINENGIDHHFSMEQWEGNTEYEIVESNDGFKYYGLKYWILNRYQYVCDNYNIECDSVFYLNNE
ncbi:hypothetical protein BCR32DRAFT_295493 [Anaeromyces robustus]|uniref:Coth-domain-containing protein n=1 Tax=Anaeromyces robustus TaxID=1754192 RepID=A0A1Y1WW33_9FUNG|nr:hypothetical protein BCR32DRAFT_295493 [Anaeromyces robustus]|eukprot:ORX77672.1 hypothetical protein BCR32DRAFT_295493 [Anaeromyces robustus]